MASSLVMFRSMVWVGHNTNLQSMQAINTICGVRSEHMYLLYKSERLLWIVHSCWCFISTVEQVCITKFINTVLHSLYSPEDHSILYAVCGDIVFIFVLVLLMSSLMFLTHSLNVIQPIVWLVWSPAGCHLANVVKHNLIASVDHQGYASEGAIQVHVMWSSKVIHLLCVFIFWPF